MKEKKWLVLGGFVLVAAVLIVAFSFAGKDKSSKGGEEDVGREVSMQEFFSISHQKTSEEVSKRRPIAVMVENHPDSRPQSGLSQAEVVYEIVAEGGITRYLAVFQQDVARIGPVRSARPYYAEIADSWRALYAHVGGSPEALNYIKSGKLTYIDDINEFYNGDYFKRDKNRLAPHNVYTSTDDLYNYLKNEDLDTDLRAQSPGLEFTNEVPQGQVATEFSIDFSDPEFLVKFNYDSVQKKYIRTLAGKEDVDAGNSENLAPSTVIVLETQISEIAGDKEGRMLVTTTGQGAVKVFSGGVVQIGVWKRDVGGQFKFSDELGRSLKVLPGQVWIAVLESLSEQLR